MALGTDFNFDIRDIWTILLKRKWLIVIPIIIAGAAAYGVSYIIEPAYESSTIVSVSQEVPLSTELERLIGNNDIGRMRDSERRELLRGYYNELTSTKYLEQVVDRLKLDESPDYDAEAKRLADMRPGVDPSQMKFNLIQNDLKDRIDIQFVARDQVEIITEASSARVARDLANTLADVFVVEKLRQELADIHTTGQFSDVQLERYEREIQNFTNERTQVEQNLLQVRLNPTITAESNRSDISSEIENANSEVTMLRKSERQILSKLVNEAGMSTDNLSLDESSNHTELKQELMDLIRQLSERLTSSVWSNPQVLNLTLRQKAVLDGIKQENRHQVDEEYASQDDATRADLVELFNTRSELEYLYSRVSYLQGSLDEIVSKMNLVPEYEAQLTLLDQKIEAAQAFRDRFQRQQETSTIQQGLLQDASSSKYKVVEPAKLPLAPSKPDRKQIAIMGILVGLVLGLGAAVVVELLDNSLKKVEEVEEYLNLPVLGVTPKAEFLKKVG